jgi:hypothetical protein
MLFALLPDKVLKEEEFRKIPSWYLFLTVLLDKRFLEEEGSRLKHLSRILYMFHTFIWY